MLCRIRLVLYAHRNNPGLIALGLLVLLLVINGVCHLIQQISGAS